jgi:N6-adenosine-specific RNA methylase IME4
MSTQLVRYDAMCQAIAEARDLDEVKDIRDKALALELYAQQAKNEENERWCREIRERAETSWVEIYADSEKAKGKAGPGRGKAGHNAGPAFNEAPTLRALGVNKNQSAEWQARAAIPKEQREALWAAGKSTDPLVKQQRRVEREIEFGMRAKTAAAELGSRVYGVLYADPPWRFEPYSRETGMDRAADNHYTTMTLEEIMELQVPAAEDCVLYLWATAPMLAEALDVVAAWGFEYKSHCIWVKDRVGTGYWFRNMHELLLVATRGNVPAPPPGANMPSVFNEPVEKHSVKPEGFAEMIEALFPNVPKLEMFARKPRPGWDVWGDEV